MLAGAMECEIDKQEESCYRVSRTYAELKNVVVAGLYTRLEIWDEQS